MGRGGGREGQFKAGRAEEKNANLERDQRAWG